MEKNAFWNRISELYYEYELTGLDSFIILNLTCGSEVLLAISTIVIGGDTITGLLEDDTEIIISIDEICTMRYNPNWDDNNIDDEFIDY